LCPAQGGAFLQKSWICLRLLPILLYSPISYRNFWTCAYP
jgi:hypothetical protein